MIGKLTRLSSLFRLFWLFFLVNDHAIQRQIHGQGSKRKEGSDDSSFGVSYMLAFMVL